MEIRVGVIHSPKEIRIDVEGDGAEAIAALEAALAGQAPVLWLTDKHGNRSAVPADKIAYAEVDAEAGRKRIGFGPS